MRAEQTGIVVARGVGMALIVLGACAATGAFSFFEPMASSGWTSYSPLANSTASMTSIQVSRAALINLWFPCLAQLMLGSAVILFGKPVGRWLARGLKDLEDDGT